MEFQVPLSIVPNLAVQKAFFAQVHKEQGSVRNYSTSQFHVGALWQRALSSEEMTIDSLRWILGRSAEQVPPGPRERADLRVILYKNGAESFHLKYQTWLMELLSLPKESDPEIFRAYEKSLLKSVVDVELWASTRLIMELSARLEMNIIKTVVAKNEPELGAFVEVDSSSATPVVVEMRDRFVKAIDKDDPEEYDYMHAFMLLTVLTKNLDAADRRKLAEILVAKLLSREIAFPKELVEHIIKTTAPFKTGLVLVVPPCV